MKFEMIRGHQFESYIDVIADLRIEIFKEYPYLYDGDKATEVDYLKSYSASRSSILVLASDQGRIVGAVTGIPIAEMDAQFLVPFVENHFSVMSIFYLGEMLLLKEYRGKGTGYAMYKMFEDLVRSDQRYEQIAIAEVVRDKSDLRMPENYVPVSKLWEKLGYIQRPEILMQAPYKEIDSIGKVPHSLVFSFKDLSGKPSLK
jgi:GNAT superfamily N-acetyltransferase